MAEICSGSTACRWRSSWRRPRNQLLPPDELLEATGQPDSLLRRAATSTSHTPPNTARRRAWSYDLLAPVRAACSAASAFAGGHLEAASGGGRRAPGSIIAAVEVLDAAGASGRPILVRQVVVEWLSEPRFTMLETIREFAADCLRLARQMRISGFKRRYAEWCIEMGLRVEAEPDWSAAVANGSTGSRRITDTCARRSTGLPRRVMPVKPAATRDGAVATVVAARLSLGRAAPPRCAACSSRGYANGYMGARRAGGRRARFSPGDYAAARVHPRAA